MRPRNLAVTDVAPFTVTWQGPAAEHAPDQPRKTDSWSGIASSVTAVPAGYRESQVALQLAAAGDVVCTAPVPVTVMVRVSRGPAGTPRPPSATPGDPASVVPPSAAFGLPVSCGRVQPPPRTTARIITLRTVRRFSTAVFKR